MKGRAILLVAAIIALAFGVGLAIGTRISRRPAESPVPVVAAPVSSAPAATQAAVPEANHSGSCTDFRNAAPLAGKDSCVAGTILKVYTARSGNTFLDFCQNYRTCPFTSVIFASDKSNFGDLESLQGRRVEIRGSVTLYQGRTEIVVHDPRQIRGAE